MRLFLKSLLVLGVIMVMGVFFIAVDDYATPERKEAFNASVDSMTDAMAETPDTEGCRRRCGKGLWHSVQTLANGIFRSAPIELATMMPIAPEGWEERAFAATDIVLIAGEETDALRKFLKATEGRALSSAMVYQNGDRIIAIRMHGELDSFRKADTGTPVEKAKMFSMPRPPEDARLFMTVDGIPIGVLPQFTSASENRYPTPYRRFVFSIGHLVEGEVVARASDAELVEILGRIDFAALQLELDRTTERFVMGQGVIWAGELKPTTDLPPATAAYRAHLLLRAEGGVERDDAPLLMAIARGHVQTWEDTLDVRDAAGIMSADAVALLGPEPAELAPVRRAIAMLQSERRLKPHHKYLLGDISKRRVTTQSELRAKSYWQDAWEPAFADLIAMLPE